MTLLNNFNGKKELVSQLSEVYKQCCYDLESIELKKYRSGKCYQEFIVLTWINGAISTANNNANSLTATARNVARMLDGGVYENFEFYQDIMKSNDWQEIDHE